MPAACIPPTHRVPAGRRIACALFSQFGPGKFPANWWMVFGCVVTYVVLTVILNWFAVKWEGDAFLVTKPYRVSGGEARGGTARVLHSAGDWEMARVDWMAFGVAALGRRACGDVGQVPSTQV